MSESIGASSSASNDETNPRAAKAASSPAQSKTPRLTSKKRSYGKHRSERKAKLPRVEKDDEKSSPPRRHQGNFQESLSSNGATRNGVIRPDELYDIETLMKRVRLGPSAIREARRAGLKVHYVHRRAYVLGGDWIEYVLSSPQKPGSTMPPGDV